MSILLIVNDPKDWPIAMEGVEVVPDRVYLSDLRYAAMPRARVFNLCRSYRYQSTGYYVSLLAAARGHRPLPDISTIQDFKSPTIVRISTEDLDQLIQKNLRHIKSLDFTLSIYFGKNLAKTYDMLSLQLFNLFRAPFLRARFTYHERESKWVLQTIAPVAARDIPEEHRDFVIEAARQYFSSRPYSPKKRRRYRYDMAILHDPFEELPPSNPRALKKFINAAERAGFAAELIQKEDYSRIAEFDALFIRETTNVNHHTYRFARRASAKNLVVMDDPESILKCTNKVFLAELLKQHKILTPKTVIADQRNYQDIAAQVGFPCILKQPDSSFSQGVVKVESAEEMHSRAAKLFEKSDLIIAQEFLPTEFDWRVGIIDSQVLFVCKYFMAKKHWQIIKRDGQGRVTSDGNAETIPVEFSSSKLIRTALKATRLIGDGLYGVDVKEINKKFFIIEINDNPNIDAGIEDHVLKEDLYQRIVNVFMRRVVQQKNSTY